jgi:predicted phosphodiesterase
MTAQEQPYLLRLIEEHPEVQSILDDDSLGRREAARQIEELGFGASESAVRRYRARRAKDTLTDPYPSSTRPAKAQHRPAPVTQWQPGVTIMGDTAEIRTPLQPASQSLDDRRMLTEAGLDPDEWVITKTTQHVRYSDVDGSPELTQYWLRATKQPKGISAEDMEEILSHYIGYFPVTERTNDDRILLVPSGDLQLGKPSGGGTEATIERFARYTNEVAADLSASGGVQKLVLFWGGDCIEGIVSQNGRNIAYLDLPITAQVRVYRRLMMHQIITLAPYAQEVLVAVVPGNHDETTREQMMPHTDSWAIEGASAAADYFEGRPGYEHISWAFPDEGEPHLAVKIDDQLTLGFTHGHVTGSNPSKVIDWWKKQSHGRQPVGEADILVSAHFHHLRVEFTGGGRTWIQIPAMDGGSDYYRQRTGEAVVNGQITVDLTPGVGAGWTNLRFYA